MSTTVKLSINGMTCNHCVMHTKKALEAVAGVESVDVRLQPGEARISGNADLEQLISAVKDAGYSAEMA